MLPEEVKRTYLSFVGSQLTAHAGTIVGFSVLLFTSAQLFLNEMNLPRFVFSFAIDFSANTFRYFICWLTLLALSTALFYSSMRLVYYGALAHEIIIDKGNKSETIASLRLHCQEELNKKMLVGRFGNGLGWKTFGFWFSVIIGLIFSIIFFIVLFIQ